MLYKKMGREHRRIQIQFIYTHEMSLIMFTVVSCLPLSPITYFLTRVYFLEEKSVILNFIQSLLILSYLLYSVLMFKCFPLCLKCPFCYKWLSHPLIPSSNVISSIIFQHGCILLCNLTSPLHFIILQQLQNIVNTYLFCFPYLCQSFQRRYILIYFVSTARIPCAACIAGTNNSNG